MLSLEIILIQGEERRKARSAGYFE